MRRFQALRVAVFSSVFSASISEGWLTSIWLSDQSGGSSLGSQSLLNSLSGSNKAGPPPFSIASNDSEAPPDARSSANAPIPADQDDCVSLLSFRDNINNWEDFAEGNNVTGWERPFGKEQWDCCSWSFVKCTSAGRIAALNLDGTVLDPHPEGTLPASLSSLDQLSNLTIFSTNISGQLPCTSLGKFDNLAHLVLANNQLTGSLPTCFGDENYFGNLETLDLSNNSFSGALPASWGDEGTFPRLQAMSLANNEFLSGPLPEAWSGSFHSLQVLLLCGNSLSGSLPLAWSTGFKALQKLDISSNVLKGYLPIQWANKSAFQSLVQLKLARNQLTGALPDSDYATPSAWPKLQQLDLSENSFTGSLPEFWSSRGMPLASLSLASNQLTGTFPASWARASVWGELQGLNLANNRLSGSLPDGWAYNGCFSQLTWLNISNNSLTGQLPGSWRSTLGAFPRLLSLDLGTNLLTGGLPDSWANNTGIRQLAALDLSENNFAGQNLPASWADGNSFDYLRELILNSNGLQGPLPPTWADRGAFPLLRILHLANNSFEGPVPGSWGGLLATVWLKPGNEKLCGDLPPQMLACQATKDCNPALHDTCTCTAPSQANPQCTGAYASAANPPEDGIGPGYPGPSDLAVTLRLTPMQSGNFTNQLQLQLVEVLQDVLPPVASVIISGVQDLDTNVSDAQRRRLLHLAHSRRLAEAESPDGEELSDDTDGASTGPSPAYFSVAESPESDSLAEGSAPELAPLVTLHSVNVSIFISTPDPKSALQVESTASARTSEKITEVCGKNNEFSVKAARSLLNATATNDLLQALKEKGFRDLVTVQLLATDAVTPPAPLPQPDIYHNKLPQGPPLPAVSEDSGLSTGKIAAAVISSVVGATCLTAAACLIWQRRRKRLSDTESGSNAAPLKEVHSMPGESDDTAAETSPWRRASSSANPLLAIEQGSVESIPAKRSGSELKLPWSDWEAQPDEYSIVVTSDGKPWELGRGNFGIVYRGLRNSVCPVAIKVMKEMPTSANTAMAQKRRSRYLEEFKREILLLKACRDKNIVQFVGASVAEGRPMLVTEFMEQGDLFRALEGDDPDRRRFSWYGPRHRPDGSRIVNGLSKRIALDVARGLAFLHSRNIVHFDLKSANILLARDFTAKLTDVGLAKILSKEYITTMTGSVGTYAWTAPEILLGKENICEKADLFSMGVVLWELCTGEAPVSRVLREVRVPEEAPQEVVDLMFACRHENPHSRPSAIELVKRIEALPNGASAKAQ